MRNPKRLPPAAPEIIVEVDHAAAPTDPRELDRAVADLVLADPATAVLQQLSVCPDPLVAQWAGKLLTGDSVEKGKAHRGK
jgi:hypothetical protein